MSGNPKAGRKKEEREGGKRGEGVGLGRIKTKCVAVSSQLV